MSPIAPRIFKTFILSAVLICGVGCASHPFDSSPETEGDKKDTVYTKVYPYSFEAVWRAAQLSVKYPIAVNNSENGILETEWIKSMDGFVSPIATKEPSSGHHYKILLTVVKGKVEAHHSIRVTVRKTIERQLDFFSDAETLTSDGLEEKVLLYRIEREIIIDEALKKAAKRGT